MSTSTDRRGARHRRHRRVRRRVQGTPVRPRLSVFRSAKHISAQVIDDSTGTTVASATTLQAGVADGLDRETDPEQSGDMASLVRRYGGVEQG